MASMTTKRILSRCKFTNRSILQSFVTRFPCRNLSTNSQTEPKVTNVSEVSDLINPLTSPDFFKVHNLFTVEDLFNAKVHFGHKEGSLDDRMRPFIFGSRLGHIIFDLDQTAELLREALNFAAHIAFNKGIILFVAKNPHICNIVENTAKECQEFAHTRYWKSGTLTNSTREFGVIVRLPDLCIFLHTMESVVYQHVGIKHAAKMTIPTIGIVDSNCNPNLITYPVPGNDDTPCAIELYCKLFKNAIMRGKLARKVMDSVVNK
ncbi:mitochondrial ribosomal protein S2 isoform X2 [Nomia melanderi]|uniref:mitochondrial ribosomal protein S2 isoform X2 n=1 Tax=Nomia melanderi TaxID=2448451 RepID=UPI0013045734|nr:28S ribosomal protein S2, mitochondrial isoform X2 [Nomia melanderi]